MRLLDRGVAGSKAKLVTGAEVGKVHIGAVSLQEKFLKDFGRNGEKANRAIKSDVMGRLTNFRQLSEWVVGEGEHAVEVGGKEHDSCRW